MGRKIYDDRDTEFAPELTAADFDLCSAEHSYKKRFLASQKHQKTGENSGKEENVK